MPEHERNNPLTMAKLARVLSPTAWANAKAREAVAEGLRAVN